MRGFSFQVSGLQRDDAVGHACSYRAPLTRIPSTDIQQKKRFKIACHELEFSESFEQIVFVLLGCWPEVRTKKKYALK